MLIVYVAGEENDCSTNAYLLLQENDNVVVEVDEVPMEEDDPGEEEVIDLDVNDDDSGSGAQQLDVDYVDFDEDVVTDEVSEGSCPAPQTYASFDDVELNAAYERQEDATGATNAASDIEDLDLSDHKYDDEWEHIINTYLPRKIAYEVFEKARQWIELVVNTVKPYLSTIRCRLCFYHARAFSIVSSRTAALSKEEGKIKGTMTENNKMITRHITAVTHTEVIHALKQEKIDLLNGVTFEEPRHLHRTCANFRNVYFGMITNMSFRSHTILTQLQELNFGEEDIKLGNLCRSVEAARKIAISISSKMHDDLMEYLKNEEPYLSIITDGSTG